MAAAANIYALALKGAWQGQINLTSDTLKMALLGSGYTPNLTTDQHFSDVNSHEVTGAGYTAGGVTLASVTLTLTAANSWAQVWANTTGYSYGQIVRPSPGNGLLYRCVIAGISGGSAPTFPTNAGDTVVDGSVKWSCLGDAVLVFTSATAQWTTATFTADYAVIYDAQSGTPSAEPLILLETFAAAQSPVAQTFQIPPDSVLGWFAFSPPA